MIEEIEPLLIGELKDIDKDSAENFEYEETNYAIYHLESGIFTIAETLGCKDTAFQMINSIVSFFIFKIFRTIFINVF
jgi:hypothetical protein